MTMVPNSSAAVQKPEGPVDGSVRFSELFRAVDELSGPARVKAWARIGVQVVKEPLALGLMASSIAGLEMILWGVANSRLAWPANFIALVVTGTVPGIWAAARILRRWRAWRMASRWKVLSWISRPVKWPAGRPVKPVTLPGFLVVTGVLSLLALPLVAPNVFFLGCRFAQDEAVDGLNAIRAAQDDTMKRHGAYEALDVLVGAGLELPHEHYRFIVVRPARNRYIAFAVDRVKPVSTAMKDNAWILDSDDGNVKLYRGTCK